jgi:hypothetical protein
VLARVALEELHEGRETIARPSPARRRGGGRLPRLQRPPAPSAPSAPSAPRTMARQIDHCAQLRRCHVAGAPD